MDINWEDFDFEEFNNDGMWNSNHTGNYYNSDNYSLIKLMNLMLSMSLKENIIS